MTMKLRKISETAYRDPPAGGTGKKFNYAKAFFLFGIVGVVFLVTGVLVARHLSGQVSTTETWLEALEEIIYKAKSNVTIETLKVEDGQIITQADINRAGKHGYLLYTTVADADSEAEGEIENQESIIKQRQTDLIMMKSGANMNYVADNKIVAEFDKAADNLAVKLSDKKSAQADYDATHGEFLRTEKYFEDRLVTVDKYNEALLRNTKTAASLESAEGICQRAQERYNECKQALEATKKQLLLSEFNNLSAEELEKAGTLATPEDIHKFTVTVYEEKVKQAQAELKALKAKHGIGPHYTNKPGRVFALKVQAGNRIAKGDSILKIFNPSSIEIVARMDGKLASDVKNGQEADITITIGSKVKTLTGKVRSISNPMFDRSKKERDRLRTEFTNVDVRMREVHIEFDIKQLTDEDIKTLAPGNSAKVTIHTN